MPEKKTAEKEAKEVEKAKEKKKKAVKSDKLNFTAEIIMIFFKNETHGSVIHSTNY